MADAAAPAQAQPETRAGAPSGASFVAPRGKWALGLILPLALAVGWEAAVRFGGFREDFAFAQDYDLWSQFAFAGNVAALPDPLVRYREAEGSMTATIAADADDVDRISRANMRRLGLAGARVADRIDREAAWHLLLAGTRELTLPHAAATARDILVLERVFARCEGLPAGLRLRRRAALLFQLTRALTRIAARAARLRD